MIGLNPDTTEPFAYTSTDADLASFSLSADDSPVSTEVTPDAPVSVTESITAAQEAAIAFVAQQPRSTRIGVVAFAGGAQLVQPPTLDRGDIEAAIARFDTLNTEDETDPSASPSEPEPVSEIPSAPEEPPATSSAEPPG